MESWNGFFSVAKRSESHPAWAEFIADRVERTDVTEISYLSDPSEVPCSIRSIYDAYEKLQKHDFSSDLFLSATRKGQAEISGFDGMLDGVCQHSFSMLNGNFLMFKSEYFVFFVVQVRRAVDAIIIPGLGVAVGRKLESVEKACRGFIRELYKKFDDFLPYIQSGPRFGGLLISNCLPYHYYYDVLPGFFWLVKQHKSIVASVGLAAHKGAAFFDASLAFDKPRGTVELPKIGASEIYCTDGEFYISCLRNENYKRWALIDNCDNQIRSIVSAAEDQVSADILAFDWSKPALWVGVLAGKRGWQEQVEALSLILSNDFYVENINVVFDGMTSDIFSDLDLDNEHQRVIESLAASANIDSRRIINLNGRRSIDKLYAASKVDFFITDAATSSIYVSRFYAKNGVCHSLGRARIVGHKHGPAYHLNDVRVVDLEPSNSWILARYSIDPNHFVKVFVEEAKTFLPIKERLV